MFEGEEFLMSASDHLREILDNRKISKNALIREIGIDRSTFYQIISGKRTATPSQFQDILKKLNLDPEERVILTEEYEKDKIGESVFEERAEIKSFLYQLDKLSVEDNNAIEQCSPQLIDKILSETASGQENPYIQILLPFNLMVKLNIYHEIFSISMSSNTEIQLEFVLAPSAMNITLNCVLDNLLECVKILSAKNLHIHAGNITTVTESQSFLVPYPYYIIYSNHVILISEEGNDLRVIDDISLVNSYKSKFQHIMQRAENAIQTNRSLPIMMRNLTSYFHQYADQSIYLINAEPCVSLSATEDQIKSYIDSDNILSFKRILENSGIIEFSNNSGVTHLLSRQIVEESGLKINVKAEDLPILKQNIENRIGQNLFLLNEQTVTLPHEWDVFIFGRDLVIIIPHYTYSFYISISSRQVAEKFESWLASRLNTVNADVKA